MSPVTATNIVSLRLNEIMPSPLNPRRHSHAQLTEAQLRPLGESLLKGGQWELITVRPHSSGKFELVNGERRWRAALLVKLASLEARVEQFSDAQALDMMLATGGQDQPLSPMALAHGFAERMAMDGLTQTALAEQLGVDRYLVHCHVALLELPEEMQTAVDEGRVALRTAYVVAMLPGEADRAALAKEVLHPVTQEEPLSIRAAELLRAAKYSRSLANAPFDPKDAKLVPDAGACSSCPWRAGNNPEAYGETDRAQKHTCMKPECFETKLQAVRERIAAKFKLEGVEPLSAGENEEAFPRGQSGLSHKVALVEWSKPVPADLLKTEVAAKGAPKWEDICGGDKAEVVVRVGFDQQNRPVRLVRVSEAVIAADENERAIFNEETRVRYGLANQSARVGAPAPGQRATGGTSKAEPEPKASVVAGETETVTLPPGTKYVEEPDARVSALQAELACVGELLRDVAESVWPHLVVALRIDVEASLGRLGIKLKVPETALAPVPGDDAEAIEKLRAEVEEAFVAAGLMTDETRGRVCRVAVRGAKDWPTLKDEAGLRKLVKFLKSKKAAVVAPKEEE